MRFTICLLTTLMISLASAAQSAPTDGVAVLKGLISDPDPKIVNMAILALRATDDRDLVPLMQALSKSGNRGFRLFAVSSISQLVWEKKNPLSPDQERQHLWTENDAGPLLIDRIANDSDNTVRAEALQTLVDLKLQTGDVLMTAAKLGDESVQCIAARALVDMGRLDDARRILPKLVESKDSPTSAMARMCLLAAGNTDMLAPLRQIIRDKATDTIIVSLLLEQIGDMKISAARPVAEDAIAAEHLDPMLKVRAYRAISAIDKDGAALLAKAIAATDHRRFQCFMIRTLAERPDSADALKTLAKLKDMPGILARLELARMDKDLKGIATPLDEAINLGHPIVIEYVMDVARKDARERHQAADAYTPALLKFVQSVSRDETSMKPEHIQAALAIKLLVELNSERSLAGVKKITTGPYDALLRMTATGLYKCDNLPAACELAAPLLKSVYEDVRQDAALTLGRNGDRRAMAELTNIVSNAQDKPALLAVASWYLLKTQGKSADAAKELAKTIK